MKDVLSLRSRSLYLFIVLLSPTMILPYSESAMLDRHGAIQLSVNEMSQTIGGEIGVVIQAPPSTWYGIIGGSIIGFAVSGAAGILPGALIGALVWVFFIGG